MPDFLRILVFCLLALPAAALWAAENPAPQDSSQQNAQQESAEAGQTDDIVLDEENTASGSDEDESETESPGRFIPTEEISQDLGVSFPVDI